MQNFHELVEEHLKAGASAHDVHKKCIRPFDNKGWLLGHVSGHSIGMTMIEFPRIGEGTEFELPENMVCSLHPHVMTEDRSTCLYFQETSGLEKTAANPCPVCRLLITRAVKPAFDTTNRHSGEQR